MRDPHDPRRSPTVQKVNFWLTLAMIVLVVTAVYQGCSRGL